jgi:hypothetical protein
MIRCRIEVLVSCGMVALLACDGQPGASPPPVAQVVVTPQPLRDPCGGAQELLKKYLSASPCVFVLGEASIQATYSGTNVTTTVGPSSHAVGYPGALLNIGITSNAQITVVLPSFSQISSTQTGVDAGASDMEFRYKQLLYFDPTRGILGGVLVTYQAPTGSPALTAPGPSYELNPLLNIALNKARSIGTNLSFPVENLPPSEPFGNRTWTFAPQAVLLWRSPGATLLALVGQYSFTTNDAYLTINAAQLLSRNVQLQATYGGNSSLVDYVNPLEDIGRSTAAVYRRSFTIGFSYLVGRSEPPAP